MKKRLQGLILGILIGAVITGGVVFSQQISKTAELCYNNIKVFVDGEEIIPRDVLGNIVEPFSIDDTTYLPVRAIANALGKEVVWEEETQSVYISSSQGDSMVDADKTVTVYAPDGRTIEVLSSEVEAYQKVGWYIEPVVIMYAPDGRNLVVSKNEIPAYQNVGWYETYQEAMAVKESTRNENQNTRGVYRTPKGKRYHLDPDCGGKNSYSTTLQKAKNAGLTPCKKCAQ